jgi:hypothetical protein
MLLKLYMKLHSKSYQVSPLFQPMLCLDKTEQLWVIDSYFFFFARHHKATDF